MDGTPRARHAGADWEQGVLREVEFFPALSSIPARLGLSIEYEGRRFTGVLFLDDPDFLTRPHGILNGCLGHPLPEIGSLEIEG